MGYSRGFSSLGCPQATLAQAFALAEKHGLQFVELRTLGGTVDLPAYFAEHYKTPTGLAAAASKTAVRLAGFGASMKLIDNTEADRQALLAWVPWAEAAGVRWLRIFDGGKTAEGAEIERAAATLQWWAELRRERGWRVDLMVETHDSLTTTPAIQRVLSARTDVHLLWDTHHTWKKGGEDPVATWRALHDHIVHIHIKDSIPVPSARHPFTYVLPGEGGFPAEALVRVLRAEYSGGLSLEWEKQWHPYLPELDAALSAAAERGWW